MTHHPTPSHTMDDEEDDVPTCPLCLEELDATDRAVEACQCGYQVCLWCLHHIREQLNSRCPACRTPYQEQNFKYGEVNHEEAAKEARERANAKKERERREKIREIEKERARAAAVSQQKAKNNLKHARILQKNLVYVIGLSLTLAREDIIRRSDMFGKFGRLTRILVNRAHPFNTDAPGGPSISAYVQYGRDSDASAAVRTMNNAVLDGREIRCAIATTKYCDTFVRNAAISDPNPAHFCGNHNCMYYHSLSQEATLSREEVLARQLGPPPPAHLFLPADTRRLHPGMRMLHSSPPPSAKPIPLRPVINAAPNMGPGPSSTNPPSVALSNTSAPIIHPPIHPVTTSFPSPLPSSCQPPQFLARKPLNTSPHRTPPSSPQSTQVPQLDQSSPRPEATFRRGPLPIHSLSSQTPAPSSRLVANFGWDGSIVGQGASRRHPRLGPSVSLDDPSQSRNHEQPMTRDNAPPGFEEPSSPSASSSALSRPPGFDGPKLSRPSNESISNHETPQRDNGRPTSSTIAPPPGFGPGSALKKDVGQLASDVAAAWSQKASSDQVFLAKPRRATGGAIGQVGSQQVTQDDVKSRSELAEVLAKIGGDLGVSSEIHDVHTASHFATVAPRTSVISGNLDSLFGNQGTATAFVPSLRSQPGTPGPLASGDDVTFSTTPQFNGSLASPPVRGLFPSPRVDVSSSSLRSNSRFGFAREDSPEKPAAPVPQSTVPLPRSTLVTMMTSQESQGNRQHGTFRINGKAGKGPLSSLTQTLNDVSVGRAAKPRQFTGRNGRSRFDFADQGPSPPKASQMLRPANIDGGASSRVTLAAQPPLRSSSKPPVSDAFIVSFAQLSREEKLASLFNSAQWAADQLPPMPTVATQPDAATKVNPTSAPLISSKAPKDSNGKAFRNAASNGPDSIQIDGNRRGPTSTDSPTVQFTPPGFREAAPGNTPEKKVVEGTSTSTGVATTVASGGVPSSTPSMRLSSDVSHVGVSTTFGTDSLEEERKRNGRAQRKRDRKLPQAKDINDRKPSTTQRLVLTSAQPLFTPVQEARPAQVLEQAPRHAGQTVISIQPPGPDVLVTSGSTIQTQSTTGEVAPAKQAPTLTPAPERLESTCEPTQEANVPISNLTQVDPGLVVVHSKKRDKKDKFMSVSELEKEVEAARAREAHLRDKLLELQRRIESYDGVRT